MKILDEIFMKILDEQEVDRVVNLAHKHEMEYLDDYTRVLKKGDYWDTNFIDYKCYRVFIKEYKSDIQLYMDEYYKETGKMVSFEEAGWGLYLMATGQEPKNHE